MTNGMPHRTKAAAYDFSPVAGTLGQILYITKSITVIHLSRGGIMFPEMFSKILKSDNIDKQVQSVFKMIII